MPNCYTLTLKGSREPEALQKVDDEIREFFCQPPSETEWFENWHNSIGLRLACGMSFDDIRKDFQKGGEINNTLIEIANYLENKYTVDCWFSR